MGADPLTLPFDNFPTSSAIYRPSLLTLAPTAQLSFPPITTKMKLLLTKTLLAFALVHCAYASADDHEELGGLDADEDDELTLISCDEENPAKFSISRKAALMCNLVKNIIEGDKTAKEIEIKKVS